MNEVQRKADAFFGTLRCAYCGHIILVNATMEDGLIVHDPAHAPSSCITTRGFRLYP